MNSVLDAQADFCMVLADNHALAFMNRVYACMIPGMPVIKAEEHFYPDWKRANEYARNQRMLIAFEKTLGL